MTTHSKRAVLIDYLPHSGLALLAKKRSPCLLPVVGKPLIHHWCEKLATDGVEEIKVLLSNSPFQVRQYVGDGARWGFKEVSYQYHPQLIDWEDAKKYLADYWDTTTLVINLSSLPMMDLHSIPLSSDFWFGHNVSKTFSMGIRRIDSIAALWQANMDFLNDIAQLPEDMYVPDSRNLITAPGGEISESVSIESTSLVGTQTVIRNQVRLDSAIIGDGCLIEPSTHIKMSVILDNTYIGSHTDLNYAVVDGPMIHRIDMGTTAWIDDPALLAKTNEMTSSGTSSSEKCLALVLLLITWPLVIFRRKQTETIRIPAGYDHKGAVHYRSFSVESITTNHRLLRKLPWLKQVIRGELPLFGINRDSADLPGWAADQENYCPGVISLAELNSHLFEDSDEMTILVSNNYQIANTSTKSNCKLLFQWLLALISPIKRTEKNECII
jgi:hypothetical protein